MAICPACGNEVASSSSFCTSCGQRMPAATAAAPAASPAFCTGCGTKLPPGTSFCTSCGQPVASAQTPATVAYPAPAATPPVVAAPVSSAPPAAAASAPAPTAVTPTPSPAEPAPIRSAEPIPQTAADAYPVPAYAPMQQPTGGGFGKLVAILLLVIVLGGLGGWYFWGVETVVVCSPPDVTVFLDGKEIQQESLGRYVIPHLSRKTHLLRIQSPGFADTIQKLDFPLTSAHEWVNVTLVPSRKPR